MTSRKHISSHPSLRKGAKDARRRKRRRKFYADHTVGWAVKLYGPVFQEIPLGELPKLPSSIKDEGKTKQVQKWYCIWRTKAYRRFISRMPFFAKVTYGVDRAVTSKAIAQHINWYEELVRDKGPVYAVKLLKRVRDACLRFASDQSFERIGELKLHEDGLPLRVGHLMDLLTSKDINHRRLAIGILDIIKLCEVPGDEPSIDSIINPIEGIPSELPIDIGSTLETLGKAKVPEDDLIKVVTRFRKVLERTFPRRKQSQRLQSLSELSDLHLSVRKGPNGPALGTILLDYVGVSRSGLLKPITELARQTNNVSLLVILDEIRNEIESQPIPDEVAEACIDSRLAIKYEPWCKTRYFAICDWFSQSVLKGLHKWIFRWLEKQPEDGTMSQDLVTEKVRYWTRIEALSPTDQGIFTPRVYSLDLSKATDRLPATIQREILSQMFGTYFADRWYTICTRRTFIKPNGESAVFSVGQPLGVYSSWAMLALTHHMICRTAQELRGKARSWSITEYVVIGDDVSMIGDDLAEFYSLIMNQILRVDISPTKGFTPSTILGINPLYRPTGSVSAEIAKRILVDGVELTPVSPETLKSAFEYPADFPNLLRQLTNRGCMDSTVQPVAPLALAAAGYKPDTANIFATFPLRPGLPLERLKDVLENSTDWLSYIPWFQPDVPFTESELETVFRWVVRSSLQKTLDKFRDDYNKFIAISQRPIQINEWMYHFRTQEYIVRALVNKAMLYILSLVVETNALNFQGPGLKLDEIASALNAMTDLELALLGKPSNKRENLHRMRSKVITKLVPRVQHVVRKAREYFGILLLDAGEQINFVPETLVNVLAEDTLARGMLRSEANRLAHDFTFLRTRINVERRTLEVSTSA